MVVNVWCIIRDVRSPPVAGVLNGAGGSRPCLKHASLAAIIFFCYKYNYNFSAVYEGQRVSDAGTSEGVHIIVTIGISQIIY